MSRQGNVLNALVDRATKPLKLVQVTSANTSFTKDTAKSVDISVDNQSGYEFVTWINPTGFSVTGSFYITINNQSQCRIWTVPSANASSAQIAAYALFVKTVNGA